ncbi:MAG: ATP-binding cassette domain-containing protein [Gaiellaceae bacterium]
MTATLAMRGASKRFGAVVGLDNVDLDVAEGEVLALLGDNGAGKSTLIKCLSGALRLDRGTIEMDGRPVAMHSPADARQLGIETVYQDLALFDNLRPADNFYAGRELASPKWLPRPVRVLRRREMADMTRQTLDRLQVRLDDHGAVGLMSGGQRQAVAVSRAAAFASRVVILDEPTAALGIRESGRVLDLIKRLRDEGKAVVVVSHAMDHVMEVADRAVIMRRGRKVGELIPSTETYAEIVSLIVGGGG